MKLIEKKIITIVVILAIAFSVIFYGFKFLPTKVLAEENLSSVDQGAYDIYTDDDKHGIELDRFGEIYAQGIPLYNGHALGEDYEAAQVYAEVEKDNPIVDFVPKELF